MNDDTLERDSLAFRPSLTVSPLAGGARSSMNIRPSNFGDEESGVSSDVCMF